MNRLLAALLFVAALILPAAASEKANTVVINPGDTVYVRFETNGKKIKLVNFGKEKDDGAQVIFTFQPDAKNPQFNSLKADNRFPKDLTYRVEVRSLTLKKHQIMDATPVVGGKVSFESYPKAIEQLAVFDFRLVR